MAVINNTLTNRWKALPRMPNEEPKASTRVTYCTSSPKRKKNINNE
jgi:hypothetical protein